MRFLESFSITFLLFFGLTQLCAQSAEYYFKPITTEDGLSSNIVYDILQDSLGFMWFATDNGLNKYDGYSFKKYYHDSNDDASIGSNVVRSLNQNSNGTLWIGTKNGLSEYIVKDNSFSNLNLAESPLFKNSEVMSLGFDNEGKIWFNTLDDVGFYDVTQKEFSNFSTNSSRKFLVLGKNEFWISDLSETIKKYEYSSLQPINELNNKFLNNSFIHYGRYSEKLWIPYGVSLLSNAEEYLICPKLPDNLVPNFLLEARNGKLWIGSNSGLFVFDARNRKLEKISLGTSALSNQIRSIYEDAYGGIWVGTLSGVYHHDPYRKIFNHIKLPADSGNIIMGLHTGTNNLYANALGKGLYVKNNFSNSFDKVTTPNFPDESYFIWSVLEVNENKLFLGTNEGLISLNISTGESKKITPTLGVDDKNITFSILNFDDEYVWYSTYQGLHKCRKKDGIVVASVSLEQFLKHSGIQKIDVYKNQLYLATDGEGLLSYDLTSKEIRVVSFYDNPDQKFKSPIWDLLPYEEYLWIATNDGLFKFDVEKDSVQEVSIGLEVIYSLTVDDNGIIWMGTDKGLKNYDPKKSTFNLFSTKDGVINTEYNRKSLAKSPEGNFLLGGNYGITSFNPKSVARQNPIPPKVYISGIDIITPDSILHNLKPEKELILSWEHNTIEINYVGVNYTNPNQNQYKYQMTGYDPDWVNNKYPYKARYVRLPAGTYDFKVMASNNDGLWNLEGDQLTIKVRPSIWKSKLAYITYALLIYGIFALIKKLKSSRLKIKQVEKEKEIIAKKVEEKFIVLNNKTKVYLEKLRYIKSDGNYLEFYLENNLVIDRHKLKDVLTELPPNFIRVHRSYVINKNFIKSFNSTSIILQSNEEIPLSRTFKSNLTK